MKFLNLGLIPYKESLDQQKSLLEKRKNKEIEDTIIFCSHPPVVTLGRSKESKKDLRSWDGDIFEVERGGRATYHSPSQIIIYPIFLLDHLEIKTYLNLLEKVMVISLNEIGIKAKSSDLLNFTKEEKKYFTGVWVKDQKITSIGVAVRSQVSYHGMALNWEEEKEAFSGISPCGFSSSLMTSVEKILGRKQDRNKFIPILEKSFKSVFN